MNRASLKAPEPGAAGRLFTGGRTSSIDFSLSNNSSVKFILMGSPGAGKGTLAANLRTLNAEHVSSGDLFRREMKRNTPVGIAIRKTMKRGELVPDHLTLGLMRKWFWGRKSARGFILDGFPRTRIQAVCFDEWMETRGEVLTACVLLELSESETVKRLSQRRICPKDGTVYHLAHNPPRCEGRCDSCGSTLVQREDDIEEVIRRRYAIYERLTRPLADHYANLGLLSVFSAEIPQEELTARIFETFNLAPVPR